VGPAPATGAAARVGRWWWSFIETLRHLVFATDAWIRRAILGDRSPWDPLDLPWDEMPDTPGVPSDRAARPSLDAVLEVRRDRMSTVRQVIESLTGVSLDGHTEPVEGPGWPESRSYPVRECLLCILNEEWEHRLYAERDLDALEARSTWRGAAWPGSARWFGGRCLISGGYCQGASATGVPRGRSRRAVIRPQTASGPRAVAQGGGSGPGRLQA
jgi:DinB superfamily